MSAMSDYTEQNLLKLMFRATAFAPPATYVALFTSDPSETGSGTEVTGGAYARQRVFNDGTTQPYWSAPETEAGGGHQVRNVQVITFPDATADWGNVGWIGVFDAATGGNMLFGGALTAAKTIQTGDVFRFKADDLKVQLR